MRFYWNRLVFACDRSAYRCHWLCICEVANLGFSAQSNTYRFAWMILNYENEVTLNLVQKRLNVLT